METVERVARAMVLIHEVRHMIDEMNDDFVPCAEIRRQHRQRLTEALALLKSVLPTQDV